MDFCLEIRRWSLDIEPIGDVWELAQSRRRGTVISSDVINTRALKGSVSGQTVSLDEAAGTEANVGTPSYNGLRLDLSGADDRKQRW